jgi:hypothetical protein
MSMEHTPGPWVTMPTDWRVETNGNNSQVAIGPTRGATRGRPVAIAIVKGCSFGPDDVLDANARLIAAAPELLEALEYAVTQYGKPGGPWNVPSDPDGWLDRARAAIAKARGQS